jgi:hypothetical protein
MRSTTTMKVNLKSASSKTTPQLELSISEGEISVELSAACATATLSQLQLEIINAVRATSVLSVNSETISAGFFKKDEIDRERLSNGVVETPKNIAFYMVSTAYRRWKLLAEKSTEKTNDSPLWLDPCSGAGVFPCAIISFYCDVLGVRQVSTLPQITFVELSPIGATLTLCNIKLELERRGLNFDEYLDSKRLTFFCGDAIQIYSENKSLFEGTSFFDIVIGNPPYVRATRLTTLQKTGLRQFAPGVYSGSADLYTYFIAIGLSTLNRNGVLVYISPAAFTRAKSGQRLRQWLRGRAAVDTYIDLDETPTFPNADVHCCIYVLVKQHEQALNAQYQKVSNSTDLQLLCDGTINPSPALFDKQSDGWVFHNSTDEYHKNSRIFANCGSILRYGLNVYSGIRPGCAEAFIVDEDTYLKFPLNIRVAWFKPAILPANILRWCGSKTTHFMLVIPAGTKAVPPELYEYLLPFKERLSRRAESKNCEEWFTLRSCSYYSKMERRKIIFPDLSAKQRFSLSDAGVFVPDGAYFIDSDDLLLLGILNSSIAKQYFINKCSSVGNLKEKGRFRFKKTFVQDFPVPKRFLEDGDIQLAIRELVNEIVTAGETPHRITTLDQLVTKLYVAKT